eukprot:248727-Rhodomonas_salina.1
MHVVDADEDVLSACDLRVRRVPCRSSAVLRWTRGGRRTSDFRLARVSETHAALSRTSNTHTRTRKTYVDLGALDGEEVGADGAPRVDRRLREETHALAQAPH